MFVSLIPLFDQSVRYADLLLGHFDSIFPIHLVWLSAVPYLCGSFASANAMIYTIAADSTSELSRYIALINIATLLTFQLGLRHSITFTVHTCYAN